MTSGQLVRQNMAAFSGLCLFKACNQHLFVCVANHMVNTSVFSGGVVCSQS